ncbi:MAG: hypothetical protein L3K15_02380 [Thermoplasmata archaeon]|nr:hypothetical protein [Thermoplasmata archaeon]
MVDFAQPVLESMDPVFVWGANRTAVAVVAYAVANDFDRPLMWLEIRDPNGAADAYASMLDPLVPVTRHYQTKTPEELAPETAAANLAAWSLIRSDEPTEEVTKLVKFLSLPQAVQQLTAEMTPGGGEAVLFVTNSDRLAPIYPEEVASTQSYVQAIRQQSIKLVATFAGGERKDRFAYEHVFRVDVPERTDWQSGTVTCEQGEAPVGTAGATPTRLAEIHCVARVLRRLGHATT